MKISIIIPVYNEEKHIEEVILQVQKAPINIEREIIIIDDGSTDKTAKILTDIKRKNLKRNIKIISLNKNQGKGYAIRCGLSVASGDIILIQDADLEYFTTDYPKLLEPIIKGQAQIVYGSRFKGQIKNMRAINFLANKILVLTANLLYRTNISDEATAYKAFKSKVIKGIPLKCKRFEFCPEVTAKIAKRGYKIVEVPIKYQARNAIGGKKIRLIDAFEAFWTLVKYRFKD